MRQLFFISPNGFLPVRQAFTPPVHGARTHGWCAPGLDPKTQTIIGVVEMGGSCDSEEVIARLEAQGIEWMPNHFTAQSVSSQCCEYLAPYGVLATDTTAQAMAKVQASAGFPPLKPKRF